MYIFSQKSPHSLYHNDYCIIENLEFFFKSATSMPFDDIINNGDIMLPIDTVLFDLDGTLVDSNELIIETFKRTYKVHFPNLNYAHSEIVQMMGPPLSETFFHLAKDENKVNEMINTYRKIYKSIEFDYISLYPGVIESLTSLKNSGYKLGIVTTKFKGSALPSIKHYQIDNFVDVIIGLDDVVHHKPHPEPIYKALEKIKHQSVLIVGDSPSDLLAGKNAGILTCGVDWSYRKEELFLMKPDFWLTDFMQLHALINNYNKNLEG